MYLTGSCQYPGFAVGVGGVDKALVVENKPYACQRLSVLVDGAELNLLLDLFDAVLGELLVPEQGAGLGGLAFLYPHTKPCS